MSPSGEGLLVRYWAGARAAAGIAEEYVPLPDRAADGADVVVGEVSVGEVVGVSGGEAVVGGEVVVGDVVAAIEARHPTLGPILEVASLLLDGRAARRDDPVGAAHTLEVLPPFAGG